MNDVVVSRNPSGNTFLVNNEIEEVLSAGSADNLKIQKMSEKCSFGILEYYNIFN